ncbi:MAG: adenylate kinase [Clostridia bacterium]|nr:adenylate kinase [Clostridia bacterium]
MKLILLGAPGAGKGTQAEKISDKLSIPVISTGNIIRESMKNGTEMGSKAKSYVDAGKLVPDEVVIGIIRERLANQDCENGFILDGFPRTIPQAEALDKMGIEIDTVLSIDVEDEKIVARMSGRRVCLDCGATYHLEYKKPKAEGICDFCGKELVLRKDDAPETVLDRLHVYHEQTEPLKEFYAAKGKLRSVKGCEEVKDTTAATFAALEINL